MKRMYIITGAAGHLATTTILKLKKTDCSIRGLILPSENCESDDIVQYYKGDVTKAETLDALFKGTEQFEVIVIHMAAIISIQAKVSPQIHKVNVEGTKNIIEKCKQYRVKRLVYVSSVHAIPERDNISVIREVDHFSKESVNGAYAITKAEATQAVIDAGKEGLDVVVVHPSGIMGPYDLGNNHITQLILMYLNRKLPAGVSGGYDFVDVRDAADGVISAVDQGKAGECYILSNRFVSIKELIECMRLATKRKCKKPCVPLWMAKAIAPVFERLAQLTHKRAIFTKYSLRVMNSNGHFSHDKATMELRYTPRDIKDTVADTIRYLQLNKAH